MGSEQDNLAGQVVESFQALLDNEVRDAIGDYNFRELQGLVRAAMAEHSEAILERLDADIKRLKAEMVDRRPLEL